jgi:hypothetical protein
LRQCVQTNLSYIHEIKEAVEAEEGSGKNSVEDIVKNFYGAIDKYSGNMIKYHKFKKAIKISPLAPKRKELVISPSEGRHGSTMGMDAMDGMEEEGAPVEGETPKEEEAHPAEGEGAATSPESIEAKAKEQLKERLESTDDKDRDWDFHYYRKNLHHLSKPQQGIATLLSAAINHAAISAEDDTSGAAIGSMTRQTELENEDLDNFFNDMFTGLGSGMYDFQEVK